MAPDNPIEEHRNDRGTLKNYFNEGDVPTEDQFADLINSTLNQLGDKLVKQEDKPLKIGAHGDDASQKAVLHFHSEWKLDEKNDVTGKPDWHIQLNPRSKDDDSNSGQPGLGIVDGEENLCLFIDRHNGNLGVHTVKPGATLHVAGTLYAEEIAAEPGAEKTRRLMVFAPGDNDDLHRTGIGAQRNDQRYKTGLILRASEFISVPEAPIFQVQNADKKAGLFVEHDGYTGSKHNSAWFEGSRDNYFKGRVGVGTDEPGADLHVVGTFIASKIKANKDAGGDQTLEISAPPDGEHRLLNPENESSLQTGIVFRVLANPPDNAPIFQVRSSGGYPRFFVEHEGYTGSRENAAWFGGNRPNYFRGIMGIGTDDPQHNLDVKGDSIRLYKADNKALSLQVDDKKNLAKIETSANTTLHINNHADAPEVCIRKLRVKETFNAASWVKVSVIDGEMWKFVKQYAKTGATVNHESRNDYIVLVIPVVKDFFAEMLGFHLSWTEQPHDSKKPEETKFEFTVNLCQVQMAFYVISIKK